MMQAKGDITEVRSYRQALIKKPRRALQALRGLVVSWVRFTARNWNSAPESEQNGTE